MATETIQQVAAVTIPWGWILGGISVTSIIGGIFWIGSQLVKFGIRLKTLEIVEKKINEIIIDVKELRDCHHQNKNDITGLKARYGVSNSPMQANDEGKRLLDASGFNIAYPKLKNKIFALMDAWSTRTLYDSEKNAALALESLKDDQAMDPLKEYSVNHPDEPLDLIFLVASWVVRDDYWDEDKKARYPITK